jgi:hypothetical protein
MKDIVARPPDESEMQARPGANCKPEKNRMIGMNPVRFSMQRLKQSTLALE